MGRFPGKLLCVYSCSGVLCYRRAINSPNPQYSTSATLSVDERSSPERTKVTVPARWYVLASTPDETEEYSPAAQQQHFFMLCSAATKQGHQLRTGCLFLTFPAKCALRRNMNQIRVHAGLVRTDHYLIRNIQNRKRCNFVFDSHTIYCQLDAGTQHSCCILDSSRDNTWRSHFQLPVGIYHVDTLQERKSQTHVKQNFKNQAASCALCAHVPRRELKCRSCRHCRFGRHLHAFRTVLIRSQYRSTRR